MQKMNEQEGIHYDKDGKAYALDELGNHIPLMQIEPTNYVDGWADYDTSQGHCGLCGSLTCRGGCFK